MSTTIELANPISSEDAAEIAGWGTDLAGEPALVKEPT